ncbi:hypothetical protein CGRA01v4_13973 [Colletotrichum graminicola]|nr:hypothetical protein CGRA01v4_13973 [Colletotrichum graminicola]
MTAPSAAQRNPAAIFPRATETRCGECWPPALAELIAFHSPGAVNAAMPTVECSTTLMWLAAGAHDHNVLTSNGVGLFAWDISGSYRAVDQKAFCFFYRYLD